MTTFLALLAVGELFVYRAYLNPRVSSKAERDYLYYTQELREDPERVDAYLGLAEAYLKRGNEAKAIETLKRAQSVDPSDYRPSFEIGRLHYMKGNLDEAERYLAAAWKTSPNNAYTAYLLGLVARDRKRIPLSAYYLKKAVELAPELGDAHLMLAELYESMEATASAVREYRAALQYLPGEPRAIGGLRRLGALPLETTPTTEGGARR